VFVRGAMFKIESAKGNAFFREFLATVPGGADHVRRLSFSDLDGYNKKTSDIDFDLDLAVMCHGLHTLRLNFHTRFLGTNPYSGPPATVEELVAKYRLHRLLDCDTLRKVEWVGVLGFENPKSSLLEHLAGGLKGEFAKRGRRMECVVIRRWFP